MFFSGVQKFTMLDYPDKCACIVFTPGCNMRCGYCYNSEFVLPEKVCKLRKSFIPEDAVIAFLERRRGLLDGVVVSGGEPTLHAGLKSFIAKVKSYGFLVKLDTNGIRYEIIKDLIETKLVDYIAMDIKHSISQYKKITPVRSEDIKNIKKTISFLMQSDIAYEFRTTLIKGIHEPHDLEEILEFIRGAECYYYQQYRVSETLLDPRFKQYNAFTVDEMKRFASIASKYVKKITVRH